MPNPIYLKDLELEGKRWFDTHTAEASKYDTGWYLNSHLRKIIDKNLLRGLWKLVVNPKVRDILEIGSGSGEMALKMASKDKNVVGIDISKDMVERANEIALTEELPAEFRVGDLNHIKLEKKARDLVVAHSVLHHIKRLDYLLGECRKTLRKDGYMIAIEDDNDSKRNKEIADYLLSILSKKYSFSKEAIKPDIFKVKSPFEGKGVNILERFAKHFNIIYYHTYGAFIPRVFMYQYNWEDNEQDIGLAGALEYLDRLLVSESNLEGNIKIIIGRPK